MERKQISMLFRQHYRHMYSLARTILYDEQESKDVVSDIFERLLYSDIVLREDTAEHYLLTSVRNSCLKRLQQKSNRERIEKLYAQERNVMEEPEKDEERLKALANFAHTHLTLQQQTVFRLRFIDGKSYDEIGTEMGISRVAVWKHLSRLTQTIKEQFKTSEL